MNLLEYYLLTTNILRTAEAKIADPNTNHVDMVKYELQKKLNSERITRLLKGASAKMDPMKEKVILQATLPKESFDRVLTNVDRSQKRDYIDYLTGKGKLKPSADKILPQGDLNQKSVDELRDMVQAAGGDEAVEALKGKGLLSSAPPYAYEKQAVDFIGFYNTEIPAEEQEKLIAEVEKIKSPLDYTKEEATQPKYHDELAALKASMTEADFPIKEDGTRYTREETEELIDFIDKELTVTNPNVDLDAARQTIESIQETESSRRGKEYLNNVPGLKDSLRDNSSNPKLYQWKGPDSQENLEALDTLRGMRLSFSDEYKADMKYMMHRLDEINHVKAGLNGEQGTKSYGFTKLSNTTEDLEKSIKKGNAAEILNTAVEYRKDYKDMAELVEFSDKHFSKDPVVYSGNLDVARTPTIPYEFRRDLRNASHINSAFTALSFVKTNGVEIDDFVEDPIGVMQKKSMPGKEFDLNELAKKPYKTKTVIEMVNGVPTEKEVQVPRTFGEMCRYMHSSELDAIITDKAVDYAGGRAIDGITKACPDESTISQNFGAMMANTVVKETIGHYVSKARIDHDLEAYQNLILMGDEERDYVKALSGDRAFNPETKEIESGKFDAYARLENMQDNCAEFSDKINTILHDFYADPTMMNGGTEDLLAATQLLTAKYLTVHPEAKGQPGYDDLKKFVEDPYREVNARLNDWGLPELKMDDTGVRMQKPISDDIGKKFVAFIDDPKFEKNLKTMEKQMKNDLKAKEKAFSTASRRKENKEAAKTEYLKTLKEEFSKGNITEYYYKTRTEQILSDSKAKAPSMFRIDDFPKLKNYVPNLSEEERDGLTKDDIKILYERDKERAQAEKDNFLRRKALENAGVIEPVERKFAEEPAPVMSDTVLISKENGFESKEIEAFYRDLEKEVAPEKNAPGADFEIISEAEVLEAKKEENTASLT